MTKNKYFAGIGSRTTPQNILDLMPKITEYLYDKNYILRSGGANGADEYFEKGVPQGKIKEIFLPWKNFNNNSSPLYIENKNKILEENLNIATTYAKNFHPNWERLKPAGKKLMTRNSFQILGIEPNNEKQFSNVVICYCPIKNGKPTGGTAQALRIAEHHNIKIYNLFLQDDYNKILNKLG
jgi:hypothetical protein